MSIQRLARITRNGGAAGAGDISDRWTVVFSLFALYLIWGSTYFAIRIAVETLPPFLMSGSRFLTAGVVLFLVLRARGLPAPSARQWAGCAIVGTLLLVGGNGGVAFAEQSVASGLAATTIATTPLWAALFAGLWGRWPNRVELLGLVMGFLGVGILNLDAGLRANPVGAAVLAGAAASWAFGSMWSRSLPLPSGLMASAAEMMTGGGVLFIVGLLSREPLPRHVSLPSVLAVGYLLIFGSLVAYSAYSYLLSHVRPALATSYAYVNPAVAVCLGAVLGGEALSLKEGIALAVILAGVALVVRGRDQKLSQSNRRTG